MTTPLSGKRAIITGASQGLGAEIAKAYVQAGASIVICARSKDELEKVASKLATGRGQKILTFTADVSKTDDVDALVAFALRELGRIDVLVNNAGVYGPLGALEEIDWQAWVDAMTINLIGTVYPCRAVLKHMKAHKSGKIINLSGGGATNPLPRITAYAASKAAVVRFTESLALEVQSSGIDVNAIAPGALATRLLDEVIKAGADSVGADFHARMLKIKAEGGTPLHVGAALAVYLGSDESNGITGRLLSAVWDPWAELARHREALNSSDIYTLRRIVPADRGKDWDVKPKKASA